MKTYLLTLASTLMLSALAACGQGSFIYDQSSATNRSFSGASPIQTEQPIGQSFTPSLTSIGFVQMEFVDGAPQPGEGATVYVNLRADSIDGPILSSTDPVFMPYHFAFGITNFFFPTPVAVTPGTVYFLQPVVASGNAQWGIISGPYNYQGGTFFWNGAPDPVGYDAWFREGVLTPEPSSSLLALLGLTGIYAAGRMRRLRTLSLPLILVVAGAASPCTASGQIAQTNLGFGYVSQAHPEWPPLPDAAPGCAVVPVAGQPGLWQVLDLSYDYPMAEEPEALQLSRSRSSPMSLTSDAQGYGTNFALAIWPLDASYVSVQATNVPWDLFLELLSKTDLVKQVEWTPEQEAVLDGGGPHDAVFTVAEYLRPTLFFRAVLGSSHVGIDTAQDVNAIRPGLCYPGQAGIFFAHRDSIGGQESPLTVWYRVSGTASNGVDYALLDGSVAIQAGRYSEVIVVDALASAILTNETLTVTLIMTNDYVPDPNYAWSATILVEPNVFGLVATNTPNPIGLDYHPPTQSLLVGVDPYYSPHQNFMRIDAEGTVSHWADVTNVLFPTPLATVKTTANGFAEGATYFAGFSQSIGWLSPAGDPSTNIWVGLDEYFWGLGGLYVDQSGVWGGDLIATTGGDAVGDEFGGGVWRVTSSGVPTQVVYLATCLGGVITLTNDPAQWGPWAGRIITGQNYEEAPEFPEIYAINTDGQVLTNTTLGIPLEQINLIPPNQSFFCCDTVNDAIWEVPATVFTNHVGQLLLTAPGDSVHVPALYIVHYDAGVSNQFVAERIDTPECVGRLEQGAFAPLTSMPCLAH